MSAKYYIEDMDQLPMKVMVDIFQANGVPRWLAYSILGFQRFKAAIGFPTKANYGTQKTDVVRPVERDELPTEALTAWSPYFEQFQDAGFRKLAFFNTITIGDKLESRAVYIDAGNTTLATLEWMQMGAIQQVHYSMNSYCANEQEVITAVIPNHNPQIEPYIVPDYVDFRHMAKSPSVSATYRIHQERIVRQELLPVTEENAIALNRNQVDRLFVFLRETKILRELTDQEVVRLKALTPT